MPDPQLRIAKFALISSENNDDLDDIPTISSENNDDLEDIPTQVKLEQDKVDSQINVPSRIFQGCGNNEEEMMMKLGLPTQPGKKVETGENVYYGPPSSSKRRSPVKQVEKKLRFSTSEDSEKKEVKETKVELPISEKKTYYCESCLIVLSSDDTKKSHIEGRKHNKRMAKERDKAEKAGEPLPKVIQIPNPEPLKKKVPIRLEKKVKETRDPIVGLKSVTEYLAVSDIEMEPYYICELCHKQGQANTMFSHLLGAEHRKNFVLDKFPDDPNYIDLTQEQLKEVATKHRENNLSVSDLITTHNSDELYPWPESKAPWSTETGGSGVAPENARENYGKSKAEKYDQCRHLSPEWKKEENLSPIGYVASDLPIPESLKRPRSAKEASWYMESGTDLLKNVLEMDGLFNSREVKVLKANLTAIINSAAIEITKNKRIPV